MTRHSELDHAERGGGVLAAPAALLILALTVCIGLGIDGVRKAQQLASTTAIAEEAARAAGQELDIVALRRGEVDLDADRAREAGLDYLAGEGVTGNVTVDDDGTVTVQVRATTPTTFLGLIGIDELITDAYGEAQPIIVPSLGVP